MKMFDMETIKKISEVIRPWLYTLLREQLLHFECDLEYDLFSSPHVFSHLWVDF